MPKFKAFRAEYGMSAEIRGVWHKFHCAIELEPTDDEDFAEVKEKAWNTVINEVEKQIEEVTE